MTDPSKQLARDVATQIERRRRRRTWLGRIVLVALIAGAIVYLRCGRGWGLGGIGTGSGTGSGAVAVHDGGPSRCTVRVAAGGIFVNGVKQTRDGAVKACKKTDGAIVTVTGDARQGDWDELRAALEAVGVKIYLRGKISD